MKIPAYSNPQTARKVVSGKSPEDSKIAEAIKLANELEKSAILQTMSN